MKSQKIFLLLAQIVFLAQTALVVQVSAHEAARVDIANNSRLKPQHTDSSRWNTFSLPVGGQVDIPVHLSASQIGRDVDIVTQPLEGIVNYLSEINTIRYRHGGASKLPDFFTYRIRSTGDVESISVSVKLEIKPINAGVKIVSPVNGEKITGDTIAVTYKITGHDFDHLHLSLGNSQHNSIDDLTGSYTFTDVVPGIHSINAELANSKHQRISIPGASDTVNVSISAQ